MFMINEPPILSLRIKKVISRISLLMIVVLVLGVLKSDEMVPINKNIDNRVNCLFYSNSLSKISSSVAIKTDNMKELSLKNTDSERVKTTCRRGCFAGFSSLFSFVVLSFACILLFYLYKTIRCNRLRIISYIHSLDGTKP